MVGLANAVLLRAPIGIIIWELIGRLTTPQTIATGPVMTVALVGIVTNHYAAWLFMRRSKTDPSVREPICARQAMPPYLPVPWSAQRSWG